MKERPILFSAPMVRAIQEDWKTQTRRILKYQPIRCTELPVLLFPQSRNESIEQTGFIWPNAKEQILALCPYGRPGDRLYVREAWRTVAELDTFSGSEIAEKCIDAGYKTPWAPIQYEADGVRLNWEHTRLPPYDGSSAPGRYRHARFMPRWASRILLEVVSVRVERLQDISEEDAVAEGIESLTGDKTIYHWDFPKPRPNHAVSGYKSARSAYKELWCEINGRESWEENPWVWVVEFKRVTP